MMKRVHHPLSLGSYKALEVDKERSEGARSPTNPHWKGAEMGGGEAWTIDLDITFCV